MIKDEKKVVEIYSGLAGDYHEFRQKKSFYNEYIEMPAMIKMLGNLKDKKILDWGCGSGIYIRRLKNRCREIKGFDISPEMVEIARELNPQQDIRVGSGTKIPFKEKFDIVFAPLSIHYLKDLNPVFREVKRVLKKGGIFIFSTVNPIAKIGKTKKIGGKNYKVMFELDYFKLDRIEIFFKGKDGERVKVNNYLIKTGEVVRLCQEHGFEIVDYEDTKPVLNAKDKFPEEYSLYSKLPLFCIWKLRVR
ncbi:MAG: class I SAM-dependent methyltransferase [Nanoarchaeota archaeon]|nr:class I SAM-dependent methyltransferase [Nanoarchaeota archaeon]